jgi:Putative methyltransferase
VQPDVRRVSLLISPGQSVIGDEFEGEGLEIGCGYGYLLFPMAKFHPRVHWTGIEHPGRIYFNSPDYQQEFRDFNCTLVGLDLSTNRCLSPMSIFPSSLFRRPWSTYQWSA